VFGEAADLYDRRRPGYPAALYDEVLSLVDPARRALEAGAGTGKATIELARRGLEVVAFEPDPAMAARARRAVQGLPVEIDERAFEEWGGEAGSFELVVSAQAWHWIDGARGAAVAREALPPGGVLALWWNQRGDWTGPLRDALDETYRRNAPDLEESVMNKTINPLTTESRPIDGFEPIQVRTYTWSERYDAVSYTELLQTHSDHRLLAPERLPMLLGAVTEVIERVGGGEIVYPYRTDLLTARRIK
jgi:SAM-dependent methyltransferase